MLQIQVYNVADTSDDKPNYCNDGIEAVEKITGYHFNRNDDIVGAHASETPYCKGPQQTQYIVITTKYNNSKDNAEPYWVDRGCICEYNKAKNVK